MASSTYCCGVERPVFLDDGRVVTCGASFELDVQTPHDKALVDEGLIVKLDAPPATAAETVDAAANTQADTQAEPSSSKQKGA